MEIKITLTQEQLDWIVVEAVEAKARMTFEEYNRFNRVDSIVKNALRECLLQDKFRTSIRDAVFAWLDDRAGWVASLVRRGPTGS